MKRKSTVRSDATSRALVVTDASRLRRKAMSDCQRARTTFQKAQAELEVFETQDKPAFVRWYRAAFGPQIEEMHRGLEAVNELRERMMRLQRFASLRRCSLREAASLLERSAAEFGRMESLLLERAEQEEARAHQRFQEELLRTLKEFFLFHRTTIKKLLRLGFSKAEVCSDLVRMMEWESDVPADLIRGVLREPEAVRLLESLGLAGSMDEASAPEDRKDNLAEDDDGFFRPPSGEHGADVRETKPDAAEARLKTLFRELAFALHPDQSGSGSDPSKLELWHQVQEAMRMRDLDRMEVLHGHVQLMGGELSPQTPVSRFQALTAMYRASRNALRRKIRDLRQQREWGFAASSEADRAFLHKIVARELDRECMQVRSELRAIQDLYRREFSPRFGRTRQPSPSGW